MHSSAGNYRLITKLASGGMGEILLARVVGPGGFEKLVVIKRVLPEYAGSEDFTEMLLDEARIAAQLNHPNICQVHDVGVLDGHYFMAMEYLEGVSVADLLQACHSARRVPDARLAITILQQACLGLDYAHDFVDLDGHHLGLVHRDISPSNLFITTNGNVKILDFGVAKSQARSSKTQTGRIKGKYSYMSPEQIMGHAVDRRSDVFSLGIVFFEMLAGARLFPGKNEFRVFKAIVEEDLPTIYQYREDLPDELVAVLERALHKDVERRFQSAAELAEALQQVSPLVSGFLPTAQIQSVIRAEFADRIGEQRRRIEQARSQASSSVDMQLDSLAFREATTDQNVGVRRARADETPTTAGRVDTGERRVIPSRADGPAIAEVDESPSRPWWRSVGGLALLVLVPAAVTAGVFLFLNRQTSASEPSAQQVVVYQTPAPSDAATPMSDEEGDPNGLPDSADPDPDPGGGEVTARRGSMNRYSAAFNKKRVALKRCLETMSAATGSPTLAVEMQIDTSGGVSQAGLKPEELEGTELGTCILGIVGDMRFGKHAEPVRVTIPLEIKVR